MEWLSDPARYAPCPAWRKESVGPCPEPERNGRAGMTRSSGGAGLMADMRHLVRCHVDRLIDLDSEAGFVNCIVCRGRIQSHDVRNNRLPAADEPLTTKQQVPAIAITAAIGGVRE
jgi:hypothetical protein